MVAQRDAVLLLLILDFVSLPNKSLGGPGNTKVRGRRHCTNVLFSQ